MSCCAATAPLIAEAAAAYPPSDEEILLHSRDLSGGLRQVVLSVPDMHCGACIGRVEKAIGALPMVEAARVNLARKRVSVNFRPGRGAPGALFEALRHAGYAAHVFNGRDADDAGMERLVRALGLAGFSAMNIMLLSVSVWSGADGATRELFHWISALIATPALFYSGRIFFAPAWRALRAGQLDMNVPISLAVILAYAMSLFETVAGGEDVYFDASVSLLFFLLAGRTLDHMMRRKASAAVQNLADLAGRGATIIGGDGARDYLPVEEIRPGMRVALAAGQRVPVDGVVETGESAVDWSLVNGESTPRTAKAGEALRAGTLNLEGPLVLRATASAQDSFLAEMAALMEAAQSGRPQFRRIADRAAAIYAPAVHLISAAAFAGWFFATGDWHAALLVAISTLIITCPCALGLAVPMVQVVAAGQLFRRGILIRDGTALERLRLVDTVAFDKTGTLTTGLPQATVLHAEDEAALRLAAALAARSDHPFSRAIARLRPAESADRDLREMREVGGCGMEATKAGVGYRLGRPGWALPDTADAGGGEVVLAAGGRAVAAFRFAERLRPGAAEAVAALRRAGLDLRLLSGDANERVAGLAGRLGIADAQGGLEPAQKTRLLDVMRGEGRTVLMVGDGLNDAPALAAAAVSMAPATAADIGRNAADFVFLHEGLEAVPAALAIARAAHRFVVQNFALALLYNMVAVPVAVAGLATPLVAAVAMSASSALVVANALRMNAASFALAPARSGAAPFAAIAAFRAAIGRPAASMAGREPSA